MVTGAWLSLEEAKEVEQQDYRQRNPDKPEKKAASHDRSPERWRPSSVRTCIQRSGSQALRGGARIRTGCFLRRVRVGGDVAFLQGVAKSVLELEAETPGRVLDQAFLSAHTEGFAAYRASLEQDLAALHEFKPDLAIGTTPVVQQAKEMAIPALYFTNLISARPLMGAAGAGSLAQVINAALGNKARFDEMKQFFEGVGTGYTAGVWDELPQDRPEFRASYERQLAKLAQKKKAEEMI